MGAAVKRLLAVVAGGGDLALVVVEGPGAGAAVVLVGAGFPSETGHLTIHCVYCLTIALWGMYKATEQTIGHRFNAIPIAVELIPVIANLRLSVALFLAIVVVAASRVTADEAAPTRVWKDKSGKYRVEAEFVNVTAEKVRLKRRDNGQVVEVPLANLSEGDLGFLRKHAPEVFAGPANKLTTAKELEAAAQKRRYATDSLLMYDWFLLDKSVAAAEKAIATKGRERWARDALVKKLRVGKTWYTPAEHVDLKKDEEVLLAQAAELEKISDVDAVTRKLKEASSLNPGSATPDFKLGAFLALNPSFRSARDAEECFLEAVKRLTNYEQDLTDAERTNLAACYNNLALACIRQKKIGEAIRYLEIAVMKAPAMDAILHNLGLFQTLARQSPGPRVDRRLRQESVVVSEADGDRLDRVCSSAGSVSRMFERGRGWRYMRLASTAQGAVELAVPEDAPKPQPAADILRDLILVGGGSGFVVGKDMVVTNKHVIDDGLGFAICRDGDDVNSAKPARLVIASSDNKMDLALLKCEGLDAPAIPLNGDHLRLSTEVRTLGYPETQLVGLNIKVTSGIVTSLPPLRGLANPEWENYVMHDAVLNPGCSGGPLCDRHGLVVGVNTGGYPALNYCVAVTAAETRKFLEARVPDLQVMPGSPVSQSWENAVDTVRKSTVRILVYSRPDRFNAQIAPSPGVTWDAYEDRWCMACYGTNRVECYDKDCVRGGVKSFKEEAMRFPDGTVQIRRQPVRVPCNACDGTGVVKCPYCEHGIDARFVP